MKSKPEMINHERSASSVVHYNLAVGEIALKELASEVSQAGHYTFVDLLQTWLTYITIHIKVLT